MRYSESPQYDTDRRTITTSFLGAGLLERVFSPPQTRLMPRGTYRVYLQTCVLLTRALLSQTLFPPWILFVYLFVRSPTYVSHPIKEYKLLEKLFFNFFVHGKPSLIVLGVVPKGTTVDYSRYCTY